MIIHRSGTGVAGNSTVTINVPAGATWKFLYGAMKVTTDSTVANRWARIRIRDLSAQDVMCLCSGKSIPASQLEQWLSFMQGVYRETTFINGVLQVPIPADLVIPGGFSMLLFVENGVAGDSFEYDFVFQKRHY